MREITRREVLVAGLALGGQGLLLSCGGAPQGGPAHDDWQGDGRQALLAAAAWCWSQQSEDGRFPSATYGLLRRGESLTPFVLLALQRAGQLPEAATSRAVAALLSMRNEDGALGFGGPAADYPCYATGMLLSALGRIRPGDLPGAAEPSLAWLRGQQLRRTWGWSAPAQGGWGMGSRVPLTPPHPGHVDLSMTRRVIEGLRDVGVPSSDPALVEALAFVLRCQAADGGFFYSPVERALNKGRERDGESAGYGSATSDGLLALLALGEEESPAARRGLTWLLGHHREDRNPGLEGGRMEAFGTAMRGYYRAGSAECFARLGGPAGWRPRMVRALLTEQREDGSFWNANALQKENDPLIATAFALIALAHALT
jgi:hypothetical protein